jgi:hypothetical protein
MYLVFSYLGGMDKRRHENLINHYRSWLTMEKYFGVRNPNATYLDVSGINIPGVDLHNGIDSMPDIINKKIQEAEDRRALLN